MESKITIEDKTNSNNKKQSKIKYKKNALEYIDIESEKQKDPKYKTEICSTFQENGVCPYGNRCRFAHGKNDLFMKEVNHPNYKRKECLSYYINGFCNYGPRCHFKHGLEFSRIPRSFFQLILMIFPFYNLSYEEIEKYYSSQKDSISEKNNINNFLFFSDHYLNSINKNIEEKIKGKLSSDKFSPIKTIKNYSENNTDKKIYKYDQKNSNNTIELNLKKNTHFFYRKRLSVFRNINQVNYLRKNINLIDVSKNSFFLNSNQKNTSNIFSEKIRNNVEFTNDISITNVSPNDIQKNFEIMIKRKNLLKIFIPRNYRNKEINDIKYNDKSENNIDSKTIEENLFFQSSRNEIDNCNFDKSFNIFNRKILEEENRIYPQNFSNQNNLKFQDISSSKDNSFNLSKVSLLDSSKFNNCSNNDININNDDLNNPTKLDEKSKSFYSPDLFFIKNKIQNKTNEFFYKECKDNNIMYKNCVINSEKLFKRVDMMFEYSNNFIENKIKNYNNDIKFNSYQKAKNYCKYDVKDNVNKNLDFSLGDCTTNFDYLNDIFYQENMSQIENLEYNCISPKVSFDLNEEPINYLKTFNSSEKNKN